MENELFDDYFSVKETQRGTWISYGPDDSPLVTSLTKDDCISATRWYLKTRQEDLHSTL